MIKFERQGAWIYSEGLKWELLHVDVNYQIWYRGNKQGVPATYRIVITDFEEAEVIRDIQTGRNIKIKMMVKKIIKEIGNEVYQEARLG